MAQQQQFQWKVSTHPQAKRIPTEQWDQYKAELRILHREMSLNDLQEAMKAKHGFNPSRSQYVSQFKKWGLQKYKTPKNTPLPDIPKNHSLDTLPIAESLQVEENFQQKISNCELVSSKRLLSSGESTPVTAKRRHPRSGLTSAKGLFVDRHSVRTAVMPNFEICNVSLPQESNAPAQFDLSPAMGEQTGVDITGACGDEMDCPQAFFSKQNRNSILPAQIISHCSMLNNILERWVCKQELNDRWCQCLRESCNPRPCDEFSDDEIRDMQRAADVLFSMQLLEDSFPLYLLIWQRLSKCPISPPWKINQALIACARSCYSPSQVASVQSLLRQELQRVDIGECDRFIYLQLWADTHQRASDQSFQWEPFSSMEASLRDITLGLNARDKEQLIKDLRFRNRSFDLLTYRFINFSKIANDTNLTMWSISTYPNDYYSKLTSPSAPKSKESCFKVSQNSLKTISSPLGEDFAQPMRMKINQETSSSNLLTTESIFTDSNLAKKPLLRQAQCEFELKAKRMRNLCLRSCIEWCMTELDHHDTTTEDSPNLVSSVFHLQEVAQFAIYCYLWEQWQLVSARADAGLWSTKTEELMGISSSEHLHVVCWLIIHASIPSNNRLELGFLSRCRVGAKRLSQKQDAEIATDYIECFTLKDKWAITTVLPKYKDSSNAHRRTHTVEFTNGSETVMLLEVKSGRASARVKSSFQGNKKSKDTGQGPKFVVGAPSVTLASPLSSLDLASFRAMRDRIQFNSKTTRQDAKSMTPSRVYNLRNNMNSSSIDQLSLSMTNSLRIP